MKWLTALFACCVLVCAIRAEEKPAAEPPAAIIKAEGPVVIDGALDEAFWKNAPVVRGDYVNSKQNVLSDEPRLSIKYAWDEHYLYIGYETFDKNLSAKPTGQKEGPEKNLRPGCEIWSADPKEKVDVVEFFLSFGDERFFWEIHHNAANQFNDVWCVVVDPEWPIAKSSLTMYGIMFNNREHIADDNEFTTAMAVKMKPKADGTPSTINNADDSDTGYTAELRLPWGGLGAPASAKPDAKKKETDWKIEGQKLMLLAVVQDGDLKERYHHSSPQRKGDWFHKTVPLWPKYILSKSAAPPEKKATLLNLDTFSAVELADEIIRRIDNHETVAELMQPAVERGITIAWACAAGLSKDKPQRHEILYDIIASASRCRRSHRELLRLYDPSAYELFYTDAGAGAQKQFAIALDSEKWPRMLPEALVNAAPRPLLDWMKTQSVEKKPDLAKLSLIWREWGASIFFRRERQHTEDVRKTIAAFSNNPKIKGDPIAFAGLIRFAGETGTTELTDFVMAELQHAEAPVRAEACLALQRFGGEKAPAALLELARKETDSAVLLRIAEALGEWHDDGGAGEAALNLFDRCDVAEVRRALLFSAAHAAWPQRAALLLKAFHAPENGVLGVALQNIASHPEPELQAKTLELMGAFKSAPAALIEALGGIGDARAVPYLVEALKQSKNTSMRLKIIFALEKIPSAESGAALLEQLKDTSNALLAQQLVGVAGRIKLRGAEDILISLAEDLTAPLPVRIQCLWSLGKFKSEPVRLALKRMDARREHYFGATDALDNDASASEKIEQSTMLIKMALVQQGDAHASEEAATLYAKATPTTKLSMLMLLADLKKDHAVIGEALRSPDFAVMLAAVHAAGAAAPQKYHAALIALQNAPFIKAMTETAIDLNDLDDILIHAIAAGK